MKGECLSPRELIFDLDGTLWSPLELSLKAWTDACSCFGVSTKNITKEKLEQCFGKSPDDIMQLLVGFEPKALQQAVCDKAFSLENQLIPKRYGTLYPSVEQTLKTLARQYSLFIVSNCQGGYIEAFLNTYGLNGYFSDVLCSGDTLLPKNENIALLCKKHALKRPLYIGDTETDKRAAALAHVPFLYAAYGFGDVLDAEYVITDFSELLLVCRAL